MSADPTRSLLDTQVSRLTRLLGATAGVRLTVVRRLGTADAWLLRRGCALLVLKRGRPEQDEADVTWEHDYLRRLAHSGFPAPVPVPTFDGQSWTRLEGRIWATLTYLPGRSLAAEPAPDFEAAGGLLARYHHAARSVPVDEQRPTAASISRLRELTPWDRLRDALGSVDALDRFTRLLHDLAAGLGELQYDTLEHLVIHGDATNDNLMVAGDPPGIVGLIDFGSAHRAAWPLDLAAALWRSARPDPESIEYDPRRVARFIVGYHRESPLSPRVARAIPLLIQARGLQLISRRVRRLPPDRPTAAIPDVTLALSRAEWVHGHRDQLIATTATALA
jgi:Ser/Thr protein kinase RdoA (MazF antagonist)